MGGAIKSMIYEPCKNKVTYLHCSYRKLPQKFTRCTSVFSFFNTPMRIEWNHHGKEQSSRIHGSRFLNLKLFKNQRTVFDIV